MLKATAILFVSFSMLSPVMASESPSESQGEGVKCKRVRTGPRAQNKFRTICTAPSDDDAVEECEFIGRKRIQRGPRFRWVNQYNCSAE